MTLDNLPPVVIDTDTPDPRRVPAKKPGPAPSDEIQKILAKVEYRRRPSEIFRDFLELLNAALDDWSAVMVAVAQGDESPPTLPRMREQVDRLGQYYERREIDLLTQAGDLYLEAVAEIQNAVSSGDPWGYWVGISGYDMLGSIYMNYAYPNPRTGQFFTPWNVCAMMAQITIPDGQGEVMRRLREAFDRARAQADPVQVALLEASVLAAVAVSQGEAAAEWAFWERVFPLVAPYYEPLTILDPTVGSGAMLLAASTRFPQWANLAGLVQYYGVDIDPTCVLMTQVGMKAFGLGRSITCANALTMSPEEAEPVLQSVPPWVRVVYEEAREAYVQGDMDRVEQLQAEVANLRAGGFEQMGLFGE